MELMPIPCPATPWEEEEQPAEALARSLSLEPTAACAGLGDAVDDGVPAHAADVAPSATREPSVSHEIRYGSSAQCADDTAAILRARHRALEASRRDSAENATAVRNPPAQPAGDATQVNRDAIAGRPATDFRFYACWRLPLHPHVYGIVVSEEPAAWERFALACLGGSLEAGSGRLSLTQAAWSDADFCGGRRTPTLLDAERVFLSRWALSPFVVMRPGLSGGAPPRPAYLRIYRLP